jgi:hypothetical protein
MQRACVTQAEILLAVEKQKEGDPRRMGEILVEQGAARPADVVDALRIQAEEPFGVSGDSLSSQNYWWYTPSPRLAILYDRNPCSLRAEG